MKTIHDLLKETRKKTIHPWGDDAPGVVIQEPTSAERKAYDETRSAIHEKIRPILKTALGDGGDPLALMVDHELATIDMVGALLGDAGADVERQLHETWARTVVVQFEPPVDDFDGILGEVLATETLCTRLFAALTEVGLAPAPLYKLPRLSPGPSSPASKGAKAETRRAKK